MEQAYDAAGNVLNDGLNQYLYDGEGRICAMQPVSGGAITGYLYDADGTRVAKGTLTWTGQGNSTWTTACSGMSGQGGWTFAKTSDYILGPSGEQVTEMTVVGNNEIWLHTNVWAGGKILATYSSVTNNTIFPLNDWLGTKRMELGALPCVSTYTSLPYGDALAPVNSGCTDATEHHFTGKERDSESGNDYFGARYYASSMGRWLSPDWSAKVVPVPYAKLDNPQSLNLYAYVGNNPLVRVDPDGHVTCAGNKDYCAQVKTGLDLAKASLKNLPADSKEAKAIQKVLNFYGDWGKDNGVHVSFASMKQGQMGTAELGKDGHTVDIKLDMGQINKVGVGSTYGEFIGVHQESGTLA
jgi:RHS repeat-associated protein